MTILDEHIAHHRSLAALYAELLADVDGIDFHGNPSPEFDSNFWLSTITVDPQLTGGLTADSLRRHFEEINVETRLLWKPMHMQPVFSGCPAYTNGVSTHLFERGLCLPSGPWVSHENAHMIVEEMKSCLRR